MMRFCLTKNFLEEKFNFFDEVGKLKCMVIQDCYFANIKAYIFVRESVITNDIRKIFNCITICSKSKFPVTLGYFIFSVRNKKEH